MESRSAIEGRLSAAEGPNRESSLFSPDGRLCIDSPLPRDSASLANLLRPDGRLGGPFCALESARPPASDGLLGGPSVAVEVVLLSSEGRRGGSFGAGPLSLAILPASFLGAVEIELLCGASEGRLPTGAPELGALLGLRCSDGEAVLGVRDGPDGGALLPFRCNDGDAILGVRDGVGDDGAILDLREEAGDFSGSGNLRRRLMYRPSFSL